MSLDQAVSLKANVSHSWFNEKNLVHGTCLVIALLVIANLAVLFRSEIGSFLTTHREFSTILLPIGAGAFALAAGISQTKKKEPLMGAVVLTCIAAYIISGSILGFSTVNYPALAALAGMCAYFILFSKQPYKERPGEITTNVGFTREISWSYEKDAWKEVTWKAWGNRLTVSREEWDKAPTAEGQIFRHEIAFKRYRLTQIAERAVDSVDLRASREKKCIAAMNQKRGDIVPLYPFLEAEHDWQCALVGVVVLPLRAVAGIIYNILRVPFLILYLAVRLPYDLWHSKDRLSLIGKRFIQMNKVIGDSGRNIKDNLYYGSATTLCCLAIVMGEGVAINRPMNLKILIAELEQDWNGVPLDDAWWSIVGAGDDFRFEGGLLPQKEWKANEWHQKWEELTDNLNNHGLYILGCFQPQEYGRLNAQNVIVSIHKFGRNPGDNKPIKVAPYNLFAKDPEDQIPCYPKIK